MPLYVEFFEPRFSKWVNLKVLRPEDSPILLNQITPDGDRKIYIAGCMENDTSATIVGYKLPEEIDGFDEKQVQEFIMSESTDPVSVMTIGKGMTENITIKQNKDVLPKIVRFTQE